jgi:putative nucleotidyltransferase with HDIG domain
MKNDHDIFGDIVIALSQSMDLDESAKLHHASFVAIVSSKIAMRIIPEDLCTIFYAGLLHDIGGLGVLSKIIHSPPTDEKPDSKDILDHPYRGAEILRLLPIPFEGTQRMADYILEHHERWDGRGYPNRKRGDEILVGSQIIRIADTLDIIRYNFKTSFPEDLRLALKVIENSKECSPHILKNFIEVVKGELILPSEKELLDGIHEIRKECKVRPLREVSSSELKASLLYTFARVIDSKHPYTHGHSERVSAYSVQIAKMMGLSPRRIETIKLGALLHDIGKLAVPRKILDKPSALDDREWETIKRHSEVGMRVLESFPSLKVFSFSTLHHERWDGKGYPFGLREEEIPIGARIISVADMLDALTSKRPYRKVMTFKEALEIIRDERGRKFDPRVVDATFETFYYREEIEVKVGI